MFTGGRRINERNKGKGRVLEMNEDEPEQNAQRDSSWADSDDYLRGLTEVNAEERITGFQG